MPAGAIAAIAAAVIGAVGAGISSSSASDAAQRMSEAEAEAERKKLALKKFETGMGFLTGQRRNAEGRARTAIFNKGLSRALPQIAQGGPQPGGPGTTTF